MARQSGIFKIEGSLDGVTFYKSGDGHLVRKSGGVSKKRILKDPAFARTRENNKEFGENARAAKILRDALGNLVSRAKDPKTSNRLMQLFNKVKHFDDTSARGSRKIAIALESEEARNILVSFDFNARAQLRNVLKRNYTRDADAGTLVMEQFNPKTQLVLPEGATHGAVTLASAGVDFNTGFSEVLFSVPVNFSLKSDPQDISLSAITPATYPFSVGALLIEFFQEVNGQQYPLHNGAYNALMILDVGKT